MLLPDQRQATNTCLRSNNILALTNDYTRYLTHGDVYLIKKGEKKGTLISIRDKLLKLSTKEISLAYNACYLMLLNV
jgi:hypothetical protein